MEMFVFPTTKLHLYLCVVSGMFRIFGMYIAYCVYNIGGSIYNRYINMEQPNVGFDLNDLFKQDDELC